MICSRTFTRLRRSRGRWLWALLATLALVFSSTVPANAAQNPTPGKATSVTTASVEGGITVTWKKVSGVAPKTFRVKAVPNTGPVEYPCGNQFAKKRGTPIASLKCNFAGKVGVSSYNVSIESILGPKTAVTSAIRVVPIPTKTLTLTGSISPAALTLPGSTDTCEEWNLKGATPAPEAPNECLLVIYAITNSGLSFNTSLATPAPNADTKSFTIKVRAVNANRSTVTLHLARGDGSYIGPVLFTATGKATLNGQSTTKSGSKTLPADKTINLGSFDLHTRADQTAFMTASNSTAYTSSLKSSITAMVNGGSGSDVAKVPVGAGKAGFVNVAASLSAQWKRVLNYGVDAKIPVTNSVVSPAALAHPADIAIVKTDALGVMATTRTVEQVTDCTPFFDTGSTLTLNTIATRIKETLATNSTCYDVLRDFIKSAKMSSDIVNNFQNEAVDSTSCFTYKANSSSTLAWIMSNGPTDLCRTTFEAIGEAMKTIGENFAQQSDSCASFGTNSSVKTLRDCYYYLLNQLTQQNPALVVPFTMACGPYGALDPASDGGSTPVNPTKWAKDSRWKLLVTSKNDLCGLFMRINSDSAGGDGVQINIPTTCKTSFKAINDPTGTISSSCFNQLAVLATVAGVKGDLTQACPAKLIGLPKSQWGDSRTGIGYDKAYNCLMLLERMGAGATQGNSSSCGNASTGLDGDTDGIPNALDVDDDGDLVIDTADASGGTQGCSIEPAKSVRTSISDPLNIGLLDSGAGTFVNDTSSLSYGTIVGEGSYTLGDLNQSINYFLSGSNFTVAYYVYKSDFFPNAKLDGDSTLPAVWVTCPGVIWCDSETSRATISTGSGVTNSTFSLTEARLVNEDGWKIRYTGDVDAIHAGQQVSIEGFQNQGIEFNFVDADVVGVSDDNTSFTITAPTKYCSYSSDGSNEIIPASDSCPSSTNEQTPGYGGEGSSTSASATGTVANADWPTGFNKTAFNFSMNSPWWGTDWTLSENKCASAIENAYVAAKADLEQAISDKASFVQGSPEYYEAVGREGVAMRLVDQLDNSRSFRTPCWSEMTKPAIFKATADQNGQCERMPYDASTSVVESTPATGNYLWQSRCLVTDNANAMSRIVHGAFITPNINQLTVNLDDDSSNDLSAKDALSATDVLNLNYLAGDGTVTSVATTIGAYPITAPLIRSFNGQTVDYSTLGEAFGVDRALGSNGSQACNYSDTSDCAPHAVVVDPGVEGHEMLSMTFDRPQREAFPAETSVSGYHDVYGLSYGIEMDTAGHIGCGGNFAANPQNDMPVAPNAYSNFSDQFAANISRDSGAAFLAPLKDKVLDDAAAVPADASLRLGFTLDIIKCLRDRGGYMAGKGVNLRDLQLPYGARVDGTATGWVPRGVGNGDANCLSVLLNARGEAKTGGTDAAAQSFCLQLAPGSLTDYNSDGEYDPGNVHAGSYLTPVIMNITQGGSAGHTLATVELDNFRTFADRCEWSAWFIDESDNNTRIEADVDPDTGEQVNSSGRFFGTDLPDGHNLVAHTKATNCVTWNHDVESASTTNAHFTANQQGGGGDGGGSGGGDGGGDSGISVQWGKSWRNGDDGSQFKSYVYNLDDTAYDYTWDVVTEDDNSAPGVTISTPVFDNDQGGGRNIYHVNISGLSESGAVNYKLRVGYTPKGGGTTTFRDSPVFVFPFDSCAATATDANNNTCS